MESRIIPVITIDGPSSVGKGTLCKAIANSLQWHYLDSGAIYRLLALAVIKYQIDIKSEELLIKMATHLDICFLYVTGKMKILFEGKDVTKQIRSQKVSNIASYIAVFPHLRKILLHKQRIFRKKPGLIADGRDMGTIVFPDAIIKIFLDASLEERVHRRMLQLNNNGFNVNFDCLLNEIKNRDALDCQRLIAPLEPAVDAIIFNSTNMTSKELVDKVLYYIRNKMNIKVNLSLR